MNQTQAHAWLTDTVAQLGMGFHWDTPAEDYVNADGSPVFPDPAAFDAAATAAYDAIVEAGEDPYAMALMAMTITDAR